MRTWRLTRSICAAVLAVLLVPAVSAQETQERGRFIRFVEGMLSTPERTVGKCSRQARR
jgi:hypothetical protein